MWKQNEEIECLIGLKFLKQASVKNCYEPFEQTTNLTNSQMQSIGMSHWSTSLICKQEYQNEICNRWLESLVVH